MGARLWEVLRTGTVFAAESEQEARALVEDTLGRGLDTMVVALDDDLPLTLTGEDESGRDVDDTRTAAEWASDFIAAGHRGWVINRGRQKFPC
jgi:hypothetical protein